MSDSTQTANSNVSPSLPNPPAAKLVANLDPVKVCAALGYPQRWQILLMLATGPCLSTSAVASALRGRPDAVSKQLRVMRDAGVLVAEMGQDRREVVYSIPEIFRREPGMLDFGVCRIPLPAGIDASSRYSPL